MHPTLAVALLASTLLGHACPGLGMIASGLIAETPQYQEVPTGGRMHVLFKSKDGLPITECAFKVDAPPKTRSDTIAWTASSADSRWTPTTPSGKTLFRGRYFGRGLDAGECGVELSDVHLTLHLIGVRIVQGLSVHLEFVTVLGHMLPTLSLEVRPSFQTVPAGSDVNITCINQGNAPIHRCSFRIANSGAWVNFDNGHDSESTVRYHYQGRGLRRGQCGFRLLNVTSADSGWYICSARLEDNGTVTHVGYRQSVLLVAGEQSSDGGSQVVKPIVEVIVNQTVFEVGDTLVATCRVTGPHPLPETVWMLGKKILPSEDSRLKDSRNAWLWEEQSWTLELNTEIGSQFNDLPLRCEIKKDLGCQSNQLQAADIKTIQVKPNCGFRIQVEYDSSQKCRPPVELMKESEFVDDVSDQPTDQSKTFRLKRKFEGYPWHAGVYRFVSQDDTPSDDGKIHRRFRQICGGTLITKRHVLTAAHCFGEKEHRHVNKDAKFKVALGKFYRDYGQFDCRVQWREVGMKQVHVHNRYVGHQHAHKFDIAVIDLGRPVLLTTRVGLACVDWDLQYTGQLLAPGHSGWLSGWGYTSKDGEQSATLRTLALPYKETSTCLDHLEKGVRHLLTSDKFCAGFRNKNISACPGDSGGGLLFNHAALGVYYVGGVASTAFRPATFRGKCFTDEVTSFTAVSEYVRPWLKGIVQWENKTALYSLFYKQRPVKSNFNERKFARREPTIIVWEKP